MSPTQRTLAFLRKEGWTAQIVEKWNAFSHTRLDLFGCIDILAVRPGCILGIQVTSGNNHAARVNKSVELKTLRDWLLAGGKYEVWSWAKRGKRGKRKLWTLRRQELTLNDLRGPEEPASGV